MDTNQMDYDIIGAIDPQQAIPAAQIAQTLEGEALWASRDSSFVGRSDTRLIVSDDWVIKIRAEFNFNLRDSQRWINTSLERERQWQVHHPAKTWFLFHERNSDTESVQTYICNITPRLTPLHLWLEQYQEEQSWQAVEQMARLTLQAYANHQVVLDEGLSNFARDQAGRVYYLDDQTYPTNELQSFAVGVAHWLRVLDWLTPQRAQRLGELLQRLMLDALPGSHWPLAMADQLRDSLSANEAQRRRRDALCKGLSPQVRRRAINENTPVVALLADVHANLPALQAVLAELQRRQVRHGLVLGDMVGYGPEPEACIALIRNSGLSIIQGNHDYAVACGSAGMRFSSQARWAIDWTVPRITDEDRQWLADLPPYAKGKDWLAVHGAPRDKTYFNAYVYQLTYEDNLDNLAQRGIRLCFHGHSHVPGVYQRRGRVDSFVRDSQVSLQGVDHALICPGAVGQPRSGETGAEFALWYPQQQQLEFIRLHYDMAPMLEAMAEAGFPEAMRQRLVVGK